MKTFKNTGIQLTILLISLFCITISVHGQKKRKNAIQVIPVFKTDITYLIKLKDESTFTGKFLERKENKIVFQSISSSTFEILTSEIESYQEVDPSRMVNGKYWFRNPHHTRYLFSPSAFNLKSGEGYFQNIYGTFNSAAYAISDHFTMGAGIELISLFGGRPIVVLTPKIGGYQLAPKWRVGGGAFISFYETDNLGIVYGIVTHGTEDQNITFGLGWGFSSQGDLGAKPAATVSGMIRIKKNIALISENWLIPADGYTPIFSYGIRFFGESLSVDLALINNYYIAKELLPIGFPFVDFVYKF